MFNINIDEDEARALLEQAINQRVEELAREKFFMTYKELAEYLNLSKPTIEELLINNVKVLQNLSESMVSLYITADFLIDIEFNNKDYDFDCELSLSEVKYNGFFNEFIFVLKNEDEHSNLKEKVDNLTPGLKKILFKKINNLLAENFKVDFLNKADEQISFPEFSEREKYEIQEAIKNSKFAIKSNIFTEY